MPTPFYHLDVAQELLEHPRLSAEAKSFLKVNACAFLLGNTAPDVQTLSKQSREATHFFTLPPSEDMPAWKRMFGLYPELSHAGRLDGAQAAFLAGYICHLQADEAWVQDIFIPAFGPAAEWEDFPQRLYLHNVLRAYLDYQVHPRLSDEVRGCLEAIDPDGWLPFVETRHLCAWRDYLAEQLRPGAKIETVEVFAQRQKLSTESFYALLKDEKRLDAEVFAHMAREELIEYRGRLIDSNLALLASYLHVSPKVH